MSDNKSQKSANPISDPQVAMSLLAEITRSEHHFNILEAEYRKLASTWLLAAFAGMGYVATAKDLPVPAGPTIFVLSVGTSIGIQLIWIVDLLTYHQLLLANFLEGWRLEKMHPYLPQVRVNMLAQGTTGKRVRLFYLGSSLVPIAFGVAAYFVIKHAQASAVADTLVLLITCASVVVTAILMAKSAGNWLRSEITRISEKSATNSP